MEGLENRQLLKIMWLPGDKSFIWRLKDETQISTDSSIYYLAEEYLNLSKWAKDYETLYRSWLDEDLSDVYNLNHEVNARILNGLKRLNTKTHSEFFFYWYDKDRTFTDKDYEWRKSPISGDKLVQLGYPYHHLNQLISIKDCLVLPKYYV